MPASPGNRDVDDPGARPSRPADAGELADWTARTFASSRSLTVPPPAELSLDDEVALEPLDDIESTRAHIAALRLDGLL